ncbi:hypothetical protein BH11MYX2_BH11MYX2_22000 [soil metagenome]
MFGSEVTNGGLYFTDAACQTQFGSPGTVGLDACEAFAHCLSTLHLHPSGRADAIDDVSVLADSSGFEIEAHVVDGRLDYIGFSGRGPVVPAEPSITPEALEATRIAGDPHPVLHDDDLKRNTAPGKKAAWSDHLRVCIAEDGRVTQILPAELTRLDSYAAFAKHMRDWRFRFFTVAGTPIAVCAVVRVEYPPATAGSPSRPDRCPRPPLSAKSGHIKFIVDATDLTKRRIAGRIQVTPDDEDKGSARFI